MLFEINQLLFFPKYAIPEPERSCFVFLLYTNLMNLGEVFVMEFLRTHQEAKKMRKQRNSFLSK